MTIGALAQAGGVGIETIRYYESIGLLPAPTRTAAGYRQFTGEHLRRLGFIRRGRELGLGIPAVRELLSLAGDRLRSCSRVDRMVREHLHALDHQISGLQQLRGALQELAERCRGGGKIGDCRIVEALQEPGPALQRPPTACADEACAAAKPPPHEPPPQGPATRKSRSARARA